MSVETFSLESEALRVHLVLNCESCGWATTDYLNGDKKAKEHATAFNHTVSGEYGLAVKITPEAASGQQGTGSK